MGFHEYSAVLYFFVFGPWNKFKFRLRLNMCEITLGPFVDAVESKHSLDQDLIPNLMLRTRVYFSHWREPNRNNKLFFFRSGFGCLILYWATPANQDFVFTTSSTIGPIIIIETLWIGVVQVKSSSTQSYKLRLIFYKIKRTGTHMSAEAWAKIVHLQRLLIAVWAKVFRIKWWSKIIDCWRIRNKISRKMDPRPPQIS